MINIGKFVDLTGQKFGRLTVIEISERKKKHLYWLCKCECGNVKSVAGSGLKSGKIKSCGCLNEEFEDLTGKRFGKLFVKSFKEKRKRKSSTGYKNYWLCQCDCGNETIVESYSLKSGKIQSCGCMRIDAITKHGKRYTRLYNIWHGMKNRCLCENTTGYENYGGRGIKVCDEWMEFEPFAEWALSNGYSDELTIDRKDVNGNYCPENCRWVTTLVQGNNRRNNRYFEYDGKINTTTELARNNNMSYSTLFNRLKKGLSIEEAINEPIKPYKRRVEQYNLSGDFIKSWESATLAGKTLGIWNGNITACCKGKLKTSGGYIWKYADENKNCAYGMKDVLANM